MVVYVDILLLINLYVNYFLILAAAGLGGVKPRLLRKLLGAAVGAAGSLSIFLPELAIPLSLLVRLAVSAAVVLAAFGFGGVKRFLRLLALFYAAAFLFAGAMLAIWFLFRPDGMVVNHSVVYFNLSPLTLLLTTAGCYLILLAIRKIARRPRGRERGIYRLEIRYGAVTATAGALLDSGHALRDVFTGAPVIVADRRLAFQLLPRAEQPLFARAGAPGADSAPAPSEPGGVNFRLIPYSVVGGGGLLPAFRADAVRVTGNGCDRTVNRVFIAVSAQPLDGEFQALISAELLGE